MKRAPIVLVLFLGSAALAFGLFAAPSAKATHYFGATGQEGCGGANAPQVKTPHYWYYDDLQAETAEAVSWSRANNIHALTRMDTVRQSSYTAGTDVWVGDRYYEDYCGVNWWLGPGDNDPYAAVGMGNCAKTIVGGSRRCNQHDLRISNHFSDNTTTTNLRGLACHEGGHTIGLGHRAPAATSCMVQGYPKPSIRYDEHDRNTVNLSVP